MIVDYSRPTTVTEAIKLLSRPTIPSVPVAGGTSIKELARQRDISIVDLQALGLGGIKMTEDWVDIGSMTTLNEIEQHPDMPEAIIKAIQLEGTANTRNRVTVGGRLVACDGRSALTTVLLAADATTVWDESRKEIPLGEWLALAEQKPGLLLISIKFKRKVVLAVEFINKTKLDLPILCVAGGKWKSGRLRMVVGGFGRSPLMAFDGPNAEGAEVAVESACRKAKDNLVSAEYRRSMAGILTRRCLVKLQE